MAMKREGIGTAFYEGFVELGKQYARTYTRVYHERTAFMLALYHNGKALKRPMGTLEYTAFCEGWRAIVGKKSVLDRAWHEVWA